MTPAEFAAALRDACMRGEDRRSLEPGACEPTVTIDGEEKPRWTRTRRRVE